MPSSNKIAYRLFRPAIHKAVGSSTPAGAVVSPVHLVCLHGLLGSCMNFTSLCRGLSQSPPAGKLALSAAAPLSFSSLGIRTIRGAGLEDSVGQPIPPLFNSVALDSRNHGDSFHHSSMSLDDLADDLQQFLRQYAADRLAESAIVTASGAHAGGQSSSPVSGTMVQGAIEIPVGADKSHWFCPSMLSSSLASESGPLPILLVAHSMGGVALMHWLWREHVLHFSANLAQGRNASVSSTDDGVPSTDPLPLVFSNPLYKIIGAIIIDVGPTQRPRSFYQTVEMLQFLPELPLDQLRSLKEVEQWLLENGPPHLFNQSSIWEIRYHLSNIQFPPSEKLNARSTNDLPPAKWKIGLNEILGNLQNILWCDGGEQVQKALQHVQQTAGPSVLPPPFRSFPLQFVFGEKSPYNQPKAHESIERFFDESSVMEIAGADHFLHIQQRKAFCHILTEFAREAELLSTFSADAS